MNRLTKTFVVMSLAVLATTAANAAIITAAGTIQNNAGNEVTEWYTTTTPKSLDADGDNRYGTDGFDLFGVNVQHTTYNQYTGVGANISVVGPYNYTVVDNPGNPDTQVKTMTGGVGNAGDVVDVISYQITDAAQVPYGIRLGIFTDGLDAADWASQAVHVVQTAGAGSGSASIDLNPFRNQQIDMAFFDLTDLHTGDQYTLRVTKAPYNAATLQGVTWDSLSAPIPEPSTLLIWALGLLGLAWYARRHRAA